MISKMRIYTCANDGIRYILVVIDVFSHYLWVEPVQNKSDRAVVEAFGAIFAQGTKPRHL